MTSAVTTHVLDTTRGSPAPGVTVRLEAARAGTWTELGDGTTDADGRVRDLGPERLDPGTYRLTFDTGAYFQRLSTDTFYPEVQIAFSITAAGQHYHVPLLLSPFAYSTYRGS